VQHPIVVVTTIEREYHPGLDIGAGQCRVEKRQGGSSIIAVDGMDL
jgi:hypothetical protein